MRTIRDCKGVVDQDVTDTFEKENFEERFVEYPDNTVYRKYYKKDLIEDLLTQVSLVAGEKDMC